MHTRRASASDSKDPGLEAVNTSLVSAGAQRSLFVFINSTMGLNVSFMPVPESLMRKRLRDTCYEDFRGFLRRGTRFALNREHTRTRTLANRGLNVSGILVQGY